MNPPSVISPTVPDTGITPSQLADRRSEIELRLAELKRERAVAMIDGHPFNSSAEIANLSEELDALADAEGEGIRREREAADAAREILRKKLQTNVIKQEARRLEIMQKAEDAATDLMVALQDIQILTDKQALALRTLGVRKAYEMSPNGVQRRISQHLADIMRPLLSSGGRYGDMSLPSPRDRPHSPWADAERKAADPEIQLALRHVPIL